MTTIRVIECKPFDDQRPGTAGLRKKVAVFQQPHYLECFVQAIFDTLTLTKGATLIVGGDGRYYNRTAIQTIAAMAAANDIGQLIIGQNGILSTPAASHLIRNRKAAAGIILTASHNPGGPDGDFGIKFNMATGGQAPEHLTEAVFERSQTISSYRIAAAGNIDIDQTGEQQIAGMCIEIVDSVDSYAELMQSLFDFDAISAMLAKGTRICFDAMHAATGPYARRIFCELLNAPPDSIINTEPLEDFGGLHPDPNPVDAHYLVELAAQPDAPGLIAASDGDGDRNMILGRGMVVSPGDSLAIILANAAIAPGYRGTLPGVARSMPTSRAVDQVAKAMRIPCYETPTGWRFFSNLLDADRIRLCGEESFGTSSSHTGEKDGVWAVLFWLNMMAGLGKSVDQIVHDHWARFGRCFFQRRDYFIADTESAQLLMQELTLAIESLAGSSHAGLTIETADVFNYVDPVDNSVSNNQGIRIFLTDGGRIVFRLSGTGTSGATLRVYLDKQETLASKIAATPDAILGLLGDAAASIARIELHTGASAPTATI
jgi:phosphoglucomutase